MDEEKLGKIEKVPLRTVWANEEKDFTPWLKNHINLIAEKVGEEIVDVTNETDVGKYWADLIGTLSNTKEKIIIENQYDETDHDHLGKLLTYLAGKEAKMGVWIAEKFTDEHIAALNYLNENFRQDGLRLFGIKVEAKRIGDSKPAPEFTIVVKPNDFQRKISNEIVTESAKKLIGERLDFFTKLADNYGQYNSDWNKVKAQPQNWLSFGAGKSGFTYSWEFKMSPWRFAIQLYIDTRDKEANKTILHEFQDKAKEIEKELGFELSFQELPERRACRIEYSTRTNGPITKLKEEEKNKLIEWGCSSMNKFSTVMSKYIRQID
jgi:hypothetical protein